MVVSIKYGNPVCPIASVIAEGQPYDGESLASPPTARLLDVLEGKGVRLAARHLSGTRGTQSVWVDLPLHEAEEFFHNALALVNQLKQGIRA